MANIAELGFGADTRPLKEAKKDLENLVKPAKDVENNVIDLNEALDKNTTATKRARDENGRFIPGIKATDRAFGDVTGKATAYSRAMGVLSDAKAKASTAFARFRQDSLQSGIGMLAAGFAITSVVSTLSGFETQMSSVAAVTGATGQALDAMRDTAKRLGSTTEFSASQAAEGLKLLAQAGYSSTDAIATIPKVLDLATASSMDLGTAADYVGSIMAGFGLGVEDAGRATDVLVAAANKANTDVSDLGEGMKYVAPVARALGIDLEETAAAMGILSNAGLKGSQAGTGLRGALAALGNPSTTAADEIKRLGLTMEQLNPQANSITEIIDTLAGVGLSAASAFKIFGVEAGPAVLALTANSKELTALTGEMRNVEGATAGVAAMMRDNLGGSIKGLQSALEGVIIALGEAGLTAALRFVFDMITRVLQVMIVLINAFASVGSTIYSIIAPAFEWLGDKIAENAVFLTSAAIVLGSVYVPALVSMTAAVAAAALGYVAGLIPAMMGFVRTIHLSIAALVGLRGALIATGVGALVVAVGMLINKLLEAIESVGGFGVAFGIARRLASAAFDSMIAGGSFFVSRLSVAWQQLQIDFASAVNFMRRKWGEFVGEVASAISNIPGMNGRAIDLSVEAVRIEGMAGITDGAIVRQTKELEATADAGREALERMTAPLDFGQIVTDARLAAMGLGEVTTAAPGASKAVADAVLPVTELGDALSDLGGGGDKASGGATTALTELQKIAEEVSKLSEPFDQAKSAVSAAKTALDNGIITNDAYAASLGRIQAAFMRAGGSADQWAKVMEKDTATVSAQLEELNKKGVEDLGSSIADLATGGSADFGAFAKKLIRDMINIAIQAMIVKPLLMSMGFADGGAFDGGGQITKHAKGAAFGGGNITAFASGGTFTNSVVSKATPFAYGGGNLGVMGEAGDEAVMPLKRGSNGSLGVQMFGAGAATGSTARVDIRVHAQPGPMLVPMIEATSRDIAVQVSQSTADQINDQLPGRVRQINQEERAD